MHFSRQHVGPRQFHTPSHNDAASADLSARTRQCGSLTVTVRAVVAAALDALDGASADPLQVHVRRRERVQIRVLVRRIVHQQRLDCLDLRQPAASAATPSQCMSFERRRLQWGASGSGFLSGASSTSSVSTASIFASQLRHTRFHVCDTKGSATDFCGLPFTRSTLLQGHCYRKAASS